jgi:hypothetical protein
MKHVGKMKNNGAKVAVVYRTLPGDTGNALVVGTGSLPESWHDSLMNIIQDSSGQAANELADILAVRRFPDGNIMLNALHNGGHLKKVPTSGVLMTPTGNPNVTVVLSELNTIIAEQKGVTIDQLAVTDGVTANPKAQSTAVIDPGVAESTEDTSNLSPAQLRSKADALFKQAQSLRKQADTIDPPKSKKKEVIAEDAE